MFSKYRDVQGKSEQVYKAGHLSCYRHREMPLTLFKLCFLSKLLISITIGFKGTLDLQSPQTPRSFLLSLLSPPSLLDIFCQNSLSSLLSLPASLPSSMKQ